ncbi:hypothetical protein BZL30_7880 [Mycobacterium kansasii]|uniref:Uncharacterized protein n=1 Tax=Mycobacterium kansasii TaxID=1768 RepID=A0A1V3WLZ2_MYCKA|nr:hypothetical protein BZL30_7880 [Mycobacterium kansasii]
MFLPVCWRSEASMALPTRPSRAARRFPGEHHLDVRAGRGSPGWQWPGK